MSWLAEFHFLRPWALVLIIPLSALVIALWHTRANHSRWQQLIAPELLTHLIEGASKRQSRLGIIAFACALTLACLALAGPTWERQSSPVHRSANALIIALDLSPSMIAKDVKPSRLVRARLKIAELLKTRQEGETALIVYGDDAHLVTPLTDDNKTIAAMLPSLTPSIMPIPGSRPEAAITRALTMFNDAGYDRGHILLVTDGVTADAASHINNILKPANARLLVLGIGTDAGAPIPSGRGGFVRDASNNVVIARLGSGRLQKLARQNGGRYMTHTVDQQDIHYLNPTDSPLTYADDTTQRKMDQWLDRGPWLVLALLPVLLLSFRRGLVASILLLPVLSLQTPPAQAQTEKETQTTSIPLVEQAFLTPNQRGAQALKEGEPTEAAGAFKDPLWKGTAQYRAGNFAAAANSFAQYDSALAHYNRGNALARSGKLDEAIEAYQQALQADPNMADAKANQALIKKLKKQQEQQQEQEQKQNQSGQSSSQAGQQQNSSQNNGASEDSNTGENESENEGEKHSAQPHSGGSSSANPSASPQNAPGQSDTHNSAAASEPATEQSEQGRSASAGQSSSARSQGKQSQAQATSSSAGAQQNNPKDQEPLEAEVQPLTPEEQEARQATEQWLRQIPDDPSRLLRNKFKYEYNQQRRQRQEKQLNTFGNSEQRW
jgi:Ca-activated chloride channel family protein